MTFAAAIRTLALVGALGLVTACATPFRAEVSRFQQMPAPQGQTFAIVAARDEAAGSLEFAHYASLVSAQLTRLGYQPAAEGQAPELTVRLSYGVDNGRERVVRDWSYDDPFLRYGGFYGRPVLVPTRHGYTWAYGFYDPYLFGPHNGPWPRETRYTVYQSGLEMQISRSTTNERLFEGTAEAISTDNDLTRLVPNLVEAMFTGFPGNIGEKVRITIAPPEREQR